MTGFDFAGAALRAGIFADFGADFFADFFTAGFAARLLLPADAARRLFFALRGAAGLRAAVLAVFFAFFFLAI